MNRNPAPDGHPHPRPGGANGTPQPAGGGSGVGAPAEGRRPRVRPGARHAGAPAGGHPPSPQRGPRHPGRPARPPGPPGRGEAAAVENLLRCWVRENNLLAPGAQGATRAGVSGGHGPSGGTGHGGEACRVRREEPDGRGGCGAVPVLSDGHGVADAGGAARPRRKARGAGRSRRRRAGRSTRVLRIPLDASGTALLVPVRYWSPTGWHRFGAPLLEGGRHDAPPVDAVTLAALLGREAAAAAATARRARRAAGHDRARGRPATGQTWWDGSPTRSAAPPLPRRPQAPTRYRPRSLDTGTSRPGVPDAVTAAGTLPAPPPQQPGARSREARPCRRAGAPGAHTH